jgi:putative ABC transport system substrate-binding protein
MLLLRHTKRREFIAGLGGLTAWSLAARAQQAARPVVGYLGSTSPQIGRPQTAAFLKGLAETGFVEGRNVTIEYRWADDDYGRLPDLAANLVRRRVDVIASPNVTAAALAAKAATQEIPIVFLTGADPVQIGLVGSLNRPGGNLTGVAILNGELAPKRLELLQKIVPDAKLIAYMGNPTNPGFAGGELMAVETAADILGLRVLTLSASTENEIETAFENMVRQSADALLLGGDAFFSLRRDRIVALALRNRIPTMYDRREAAAAGGRAEGPTRRATSMATSPIPDPRSRTRWPGSIPASRNNRSVHGASSVACRIRRPCSAPVLPSA